MLIYATHFSLLQCSRRISMQFFWAIESEVYLWWVFLLLLWLHVDVNGLKSEMVCVMMIAFNTTVKVYPEKKVKLYYTTINWLLFHDLDFSHKCIFHVENILSKMGYNNGKNKQRETQNVTAKEINCHIETSLFWW